MYIPASQQFLSYDAARNASSIWNRALADYKRDALAAHIVCRCCDPQPVKHMPTEQEKTIATRASWSQNEPILM